MVFDRPEVIDFSAAVSLTHERIDHMSRGVDHVNRRVDHINRGVDQTNGAVDRTSRAIDRTSRAVDQTKVMAYAIVVGVFRSHVLQDGMGRAIVLAMSSPIGLVLYQTLRIDNHTAEIF